MNNNGNNGIFSVQDGCAQLRFRPPPSNCATLCCHANNEAGNTYEM